MLIGYLRSKSYDLGSIEHRKKTFWTVISDHSVSVFWQELLRTKVPQCPHLGEECWHRVIGMTRVLTRMGYIYIYTR